MKQVLIIGNSIAGALIEAVRAEGLGEYFNYFTAAGLSRADLKFENEKVIASSPHMRAFLERIEQPLVQNLTEYDAFVVMTHFPSLTHTLIDTFEGFSVFGGHGAHFPLLSRSCAEAAMLDQIRSCISYHVLIKLRQTVETPIYIVEPPRLSQRARDSEKWGRKLRHFESLKIADLALDMFHVAISNAIADIKNCNWIAQPSSTILEQMFTQEAFFENARRMHDPRYKLPKTDYIHTNIDFGKLILNEIMRHIQNDL